jgi:hypothetical protein
LQTILDRTLAKDPRHRYQKVAELRDDLRAVLRDVEAAGTQTFNQPITPIAPRHLSGTGRFGRALRWLRTKTGERTSQPREVSFGSGHDTGATSLSGERRVSPSFRSRMSATIRIQLL